MLYINKINSDAKQKYILVTENAENIDFNLYYMPSQQAWFYDIGYGEFRANGLKVVVGPNIIRNFRKILPFGLCCTSVDGLDPFYISDFLTGRIKLYLLTPEEVDQIETDIFI